MEPFIQAIFLATANKAIVSYLTAPIKQKYPDIDYWFLIYVALATGAAIGYIANVNLFADFVPDTFTGRILTAVLVGGGSGLIYKVFDRQAPDSSQTIYTTAGDDAEVTVNQPAAEETYNERVPVRID